MDGTKPFDPLFNQLLKLPSEAGSEATERIVTREENGTEKAWRLSGMDICPFCRAVRDAFAPTDAGKPTARYCRLCKSLEVYGPRGGLLARRSKAEDDMEVYEMLGTVTGMPQMDDEEEG